MTTPLPPGRRGFAASTSYYSMAVLWMGLLLIGLNAYTNGGWSYIWSAITTRGSSAPPH